jgi:flavin-binding protein dodecin
MDPSIIKVVEAIGISDKGWDDAAKVAVNEAKGALHGLKQIKVKSMTADIEPATGDIIKYYTCIKLYVLGKH